MIVIKLFVVTCSDGYNTLSSSAVEIYSSLSSTLLLDTPPIVYIWCMNNTILANSDPGKKY